VRILNAAAILKEALSAGVKLSLNGDKLALKWETKPADSLISAIKADKADIMAILRGRPSTSKPPGTADAPPFSPNPAQKGPEKEVAAERPASAVPPMSQAPLGVSRLLARALDLAAHYHVQFWRDEAGVLVTMPPRDYKREVQEAERALMSCQAEVACICKLPERPKHYEDQAWVRAVVDSARLGYRNWSEG
jgi:hypothetical protein